MERTVKWFDTTYTYDENTPSPKLYSNLYSDAVNRGLKPTEAKEAAVAVLDKEGRTYKVDVGFRDTPMMFYTEDPPERVRSALITEAKRKNYSMDKLKYELQSLEQRQGWGTHFTDPLEIEDKLGRKHVLPWHTPDKEVMDYVDKVYDSEEGFVYVKPNGMLGVKFKVPTDMTHEEVEEKIKKWAEKQGKTYAGYQVDGIVQEGRMTRLMKSSAESIPKFPPAMAASGYATAFMLMDSAGKFLANADLGGGAAGFEEDIDRFGVDGQRLPFKERVKLNEQLNKEIAEEYRTKAKEWQEKAANPYKEGTVDYYGFEGGMMTLQLGAAAAVSAVAGPTAGAGILGTKAAGEHYLKRSLDPKKISELQNVLESIVAGGADFLSEKLPLSAIISRGDSLVGRIAKSAISKAIGDSAIEESIMMGMQKVTEMTGTNSEHLGLREAFVRYAQAMLTGLAAGGIVGAGSHVAHKITDRFKKISEVIPFRNIGVDVSPDTPVGVLQQQLLRLDPVEHEILMHAIHDAQEVHGVSTDRIMKMSVTDLMDMVDISRNLTGYPELHKPLVGEEADAKPQKLLYSEGHIEGDVKNQKFKEGEMPSLGMLGSAIGGTAPKTPKDAKLLDGFVEAIEYSKHRVPIYESETSALKNLKQDFRGPTRKGLRKFVGSLTPTDWESYVRQAKQMEDLNGSSDILKIFVDPVRIADGRKDNMRTSTKANVEELSNDLHLDAKNQREIGMFAMLQQGASGRKTLYQQVGEKLKAKGGVGYQDLDNLAKAGKDWLEKNITPLFDPKSPSYSKRHVQMYQSFRDHYDTIFEQLNNARVLMGREPLDKTINYFTFMRAVGDSRKLADFEDFAMMDKTALLQRLDKLEKGFEKERTISTEPFKYMNALNIFEKYVDSVSETIHKGPIVKKLKTLALTSLEDVPYFQTATLNYLNRQLGVVHNRIFIEPETGALSELKGVGAIKTNAIRKGLNRARNNVVMSTLSFAPKSAMIQIGAIRNTFAEFGPRYTYQGIEGAMDLTTFNEARARSKALRNRLPEDVLIGDNLDIYNKLEEGVGKKVGARFKQFQTLGMKPLTIMDSYTATAGFLAAEKYYLRKHPNDRAGAVKFADEHVIRAHGSVSDIDLSAAQKTDRGKVMGTLATFALNDWQYVTQDVMGIGMKKTPENFKKVMLFLVGVAANGVLFSDILGIDNPEPEPLRVTAKELSKKNPEVLKTARKALLEMMTGIPFLGGAKYGGIMGYTADYARNVISGLGTNYGLSEAAKLTGIPQISRFIRTFGKLAEGGNFTDLYHTWLGESTSGSYGLFNAMQQEKTQKVNQPMPKLPRKSP